MDALTRNVYCVLGLPIDAVSLETVLLWIDAAAQSRAAFLISTPNVNFLVTSRADPEFRESLLQSDLCPVDGAPVVWLARFLGIPITKRVSGSDIFVALRGRPPPGLSVCFFGGLPGVAAAAGNTLNAATAGLHCVAAIDPGFGSIEEMSRDVLIDSVNSSGADFLVAALGAHKGQLWLHRNRHRLKVPVRAHLGAAINFQAGTIKRAPAGFRAGGFEWLWRIKEEPQLWRRYWRDGCHLVFLFITSAVPLAFLNWRGQRRSRQHGSRISLMRNCQSTVIRLSGVATARDVDNAIACFRQALTRTGDVSIDLSDTLHVDARALGLFLMFRKELMIQGRELILMGASPQLRRVFRLNQVDFLLSSATDCSNISRAQHSADRSNDVKQNMAS